MSDSLYQAPQSQLTTEHSGKGSSWKAILFSFLFDIGVSSVVGIVMVVIYSAYLAAQGSSIEQIEEIMVNPELMTPFGITGVILGLVVSMAAGYLCAFLSKTHVWRDATITLLLLISITILSSIGYYSVFETLIMVLSTIGVFYLGALWYVKRTSVVG